MTFRILAAVTAAWLFFSGCAGKQVILDSRGTVDQYKELHWEKKLDLFNAIDEKKNNIPSKEVFLTALAESNPTVVIAAARKLPAAYVHDFRSVLYGLLKFKNASVRMYACQKLSLLPVDEDLEMLSALFNDKDWMPKECIFQSIRNFPEEKNRKKYFFLIISYLREKNPEVLRQILKTLKWYNDPRTLPFIYKRSFLADTNLELMVLMQEISEIRSEKIKLRIEYISKNHTDYFVKKEAERLLKAM